jgi:penicillin amidase
MKTRSERRLLRLVGLAGIVLILAGAGTGAFIIRRAFPQIAGRLVIRGLLAPVEIIRDRWGIPHIYAQNTHDLFFAQGYVHAQDRLWQMDFNRRVPSGRLSELFGEATLTSDRFLRVIGMRRTAEAEAAHLDPESTGVLAAYAGGVNAYLSANGSRLPPEFTLLRYRPEPWGPADSLAFGKLLSWTLAGNWRDQLLRAQIIARFGAGALRTLLPAYPPDAPVIVPAEAASKRVGTAALLRLLDVSPAAQGIGSNNWVLSGARTASGHPMLANDPHLEAQMPSIWYEMHLVGGPYDVAGATLPGIPGVIVGHNDRIAWGVTNAAPDVQDLYIERFDPADPGRYLFRGRWESASSVREVIGVRGRREPVMETVRLTRHGPILNDVVGGLDPFLALRWDALRPGTVSTAVLRLDRARTWDEFRGALRLWTGPAQNFVYADREGNIGYQLPGRIPVRAGGDALVPVPGWTGDYEWVAEIPFDRLPHLFNPARGYIVTANNRIVPEGYPYLISQEFDPGYRARRIESRLASIRRATIADMERIQMDVASIPALETVRALDDLRLARQPAAGVLAELRAWDGSLRADSRPAAMYEAFRLALMPLVFQNVLGADLYKRYMERPEAWQPALIRLLRDRSSPWWGSQGRQALVAQALEQADALLARRLGPDRSRWSWGRLHAMRFVHPLGRLPALAWLFNANAPPSGGDLFTINNGGFAFDTFAQTIVASYRQVIDLGDWDRSVAIHTTGQSGLVANRHYRDFVRLWATGGYHPLLFSRARVQQNADATLTLQPP